MLNRSARPAAVRHASLWVRLPRVVLAGLIWLMVISASRGVVAWALLAILVAGTVLSVVAEAWMVRVLWRARPVAGVTGFGARVLTTGRRTQLVEQAGPRHLVVPQAWLGRRDLPELLREARLRQLLTAGRLDVAYVWVSSPWRLLAGVARVVAGSGRALPLTGFAWRARFVIAGIAVWQSVIDGRWVAAGGVLVLLGLSYLLPWTLQHYVTALEAALVARRPARSAAATSVTPPQALAPAGPPACEHQLRPVGSPAQGRRRPAVGVRPARRRSHPPTCFL